MFGFIGKFKNEVISGFDAVHQRLVTLEAKVEALFAHTQQVATQDAATIKEDVTKVETVAEDVVKTAEDASAKQE